MQKFLFMPLYPEANILVSGKTQFESPTFLSFLFSESPSFVDLFCFDTDIACNATSSLCVYSVRMCYNSHRILAQGWSILFTMDSMHPMATVQKSPNKFWSRQNMIFTVNFYRVCLALYLVIISYISYNLIYNVSFLKLYYTILVMLSRKWFKLFLKNSIIYKCT